MIRAIVLAVMLCLWPGWSSAESNQTKKQNLNAALLALEEAELRERMITALALAENLRLRGRTVLVAINEINRVRRAIRDLGPFDPDRARLEKRVEQLDRRRKQVTDLVDAEFEKYLALVAELGGDLWPRLTRVGSQLHQDLEDRGLERLSGLFPILREHVEQFNRSGSASAQQIIEWRRMVDDTYRMRQKKLRDGFEPERVPSRKDLKKDEDI